MTNRNEQNMLRSRKGLTMVEVVIALVMIAIISAATLSVVLLSVNVEGNTIAMTETANAAENAVVCFRFSQTEEELFTALQKTAPYEKVSEGVFVLRTSHVEITVRADITASQLEFVSVNTDGEEIYSFHYPAQGGAA